MKLDTVLTAIFCKLSNALTLENDLTTTGLGLLPAILLNVKKNDFELKDKCMTSRKTQIDLPATFRVFLLATLCAVTAWSDDSVITVTVPPTYTEIPGQPAVLKIDDNHEATVYISHSDPLDLNIRFDIAENLCVENYQAPKCFYSIGFSSDHVLFLWSKHLVAAKIGQPIKFQNRVPTTPSNQFSEIEERIFSTSLDPLITKKADSRFKAETLTCDQYAWLGDQYREINKLPNLRFKIWSSESMRSNAETGANENRTTSMVENALLQPVNSVYNLISIGRMIVSNKNFGINVLLAGQISTLQVMGPNPKQLCQISISPNIQQALQGRDIDMNYKTNPKFQMFQDFKSPIYARIKGRLAIQILTINPGNILEFQ